MCLERDWTYEQLFKNTGGTRTFILKQPGILPFPESRVTPGGGVPSPVTPSRRKAWGLLSV